MSDDKVFTGVVVWFNISKGFGFIKPNEGDVDVFCHYSDIAVEGFKTLQKDQKVSYQIGTNHRGQPKAINVVLLT